MSKKKKKKLPQRYSGIPNHKRVKSKLVSRLSEMNMEVLEWERDFLPEHLWIESLSSTYPENVWPEVYNQFLDELDKCLPEKVFIYGFVTDLGLIRLDKREEFLEQNDRLIYDAFYKPFGRIIAFYPEAPCYWLLKKKHLEKDGHLDPEVELPKLEQYILRLMAAKDLHAGHIRAVPLNRMFKHNRLYLRKGMPVVELLPKYPVGCTEDEKYRVQQFARIAMNMEYQRSDNYKERKWSKYFWRHNFDLAACIPKGISSKGAISLNEQSAKSLYQVLRTNAEVAARYLNEVSFKHKYDLYSPERDEILLGLFSRATRLYSLTATCADLWGRDTAGIMLRCLTETAITLGYLAKAGTEDEFKSFKSYGEGKEKLLMLHLQDTYPEKKSLEGMGPEDIAGELGGGFSPELIDIELGDWTKKSARDLAIAAGLEELYRLVYDPSSSDIHGTWVSVKNFNLVRCAQPLHKFHRMPQCFEPPLFVNTIEAIQHVYLTCVGIGVEHLNFPKIEAKLEEIGSFLQQPEEEEKPKTWKDSESILDKRYLQE